MLVSHTTTTALIVLSSKALWAPKSKVGTEENNSNPAGFVPRTTSVQPLDEGVYKTVNN